MNTSPMDDLDRILSRSAPPSAADAPALDAAISALVDEAHAVSKPRQRLLRRPWVAAAVLIGAGAVAGGAAYGATVIASGDAWGQLTAQAESQATRFEWQTVLPDGTVCVERLTGFDLTSEQIAIVDRALAEPRQLLALDNGAVRDEFLAHYDSSIAGQGIATRDEWEAWIDAGYQAVSALDTGTGRGGLADDDLGVIPAGVANEVFLRSSMRIVLDGITAQGVEATRFLNPETACVVGE